MKHREAFIIIESYVQFVIFKHVALKCSFSAQTHTHTLSLSLCLSACLLQHVHCRTHSCPNYTHLFSFICRFYVCVHIDIVKNFHFSRTPNTADANSLSLYDKIRVISSEGMPITTTRVSSNGSINDDDGEEEEGEDTKKTKAKKCETNKTCLHT